MYVQLADNVYVEGLVLALLINEKVAKCRKLVCARV
jgi:hypothetical protein